MAKKTSDQFSLETKLKEIRDILQRMQLGVNDFDENIQLFERGNALIEECRAFLDQAELSVRKLIDTKNPNETAEFE